MQLQARAEAAAEEVAQVRERAQALMAEKDAQIAAVKVRHHRTGVGRRS